MGNRLSRRRDLEEKEAELSLSLVVESVVMLHGNSENVALSGCPQRGKTAGSPTSPNSTAGVELGGS